MLWVLKRIVILQNSVDMTDLISKLYSTDASIYQTQLLAVISPENRHDILSAIDDCAKKKLPLLARDGGSSLTGQSIRKAMVLDVSKHMSKVLELNLKRRVGSS
jgi:FAD/FMN-containing dehydrogenase